MMMMMMMIRQSSNVPFKLNLRLRWNPRPRLTDKHVADMWHFGFYPRERITYRWLYTPTPLVSYRLPLPAAVKPMGPSPKTSHGLGNVTRAATSQKKI